MKSIVLVAALCIVAIPCLAQAPAPTPTPVPTAAPEPAPQPDMPAWEPEEVEARGNPPLRDRLYFGGGIGLSFGDVDYIELSPLVGYRVTPELNLGIGVFYRYRKDSRYEDDVTTNDYGGSVFSQYRLMPQLFVHGEAEYVDYEYVLGNLDTDRESDTNLLAGLGYGSSFYVLLLYNFNYDETSYANPYDSPWVFRVGVTF